jgi:FkbM family methyltransferase
MLLKFSRNIYRDLRTLYRQAKGVAPRLPVSKHNYNLVNFGTNLGGWTFIDTGNLHNATIISCGLGEDASFDIEFASHYNAKVIIVDPTPRAITHFKQINERLGHKRERAYSDSGPQPIEAYDLSHLTSSNFVLFTKALWNQSKNLRFYSPKNPDHVSHSIVNYQNNYRTDTDFIEVEAITIDELFRNFALDSIPLIKLDIEGAEIEVILDMLDKKILPHQVLVEYDEMSTLTKSSKTRIEATHNALVINGYRLVNFDYPSNFLYTNLN